MNKEQLSNLKATQKINARTKNGVEDSLNVSLRPDKHARTLLNSSEVGRRHRGWQPEEHLPCLKIVFEL